MYKINLSPQELVDLKQRKQKCKDKKIFRRLQCVYLKNKGKSHKEIADTVGVCQDTVTDWLKIYLETGIDGLIKPINYSRRTSKLDPYVESIKHTIHEEVVSTLAQLQDRLKHKHDLHVEHSWLSRYCKKNAIWSAKKFA